MEIGALILAESDTLTLLPLVGSEFLLTVTAANIWRRALKVMKRFPLPTTTTKRPSF